MLQARAIQQGTATRAAIASARPARQKRCRSCRTRVKCRQVKSISRLSETCRLGQAFQGASTEYSSSYMPCTSAPLSSRTRSISPRTWISVGKSKKKG